MNWSERNNGAAVPLMQIGDGFEGSGPSAAHVNTVLGDRNGPAGIAWATALATPTDKHAPFVVVANPGMPVRPNTLLVNKATLVSEEHGLLHWGPAQAGVAAGVIEAVAAGILPADIADRCVLIAAVWVDPTASASHVDVIFSNNRVATIAALSAGAANRPSAVDVLGDPGGVWNPFYSP